MSSVVKTQDSLVLAINEPDNHGHVKASLRGIQYVI